MQQRAYQIDLGRQVEKPEFVMAYIPKHAAWGYTTLILYLEDGFRFPSHPEFAQPCAWTVAQMKQVVACATAHDMRVIPVVPALGHTGYFLKHSKYRHLSEMRETKGQDGLPILAGQVCPSLPETLDFLHDLFKDVAPYCTAGYLHVSLDESLDLGRCSLCRKQLPKRGCGGLFIDHLRRLHPLVSKLGLRMAVWGDMFYYFPETIRDVPKDVAVFDWYYYPFKRMPRVELFNFREIDSVGALRKAGLEVWASPNNGPFFCEIAPPFADRLDNIRSWWDFGKKTGCTALAVTSWSPNYSSAELNCLVNAAAADLWLSKEPLCNRTMLSHGLERMYGKKAVAALPALNLLNKHQIVGYWHYQTVRAPLAKLATLEAPGAMSAAVRDCAAVLKKAASYPQAIRETVHLRDYYARKEWLGQAGSKLLFEARQQVGRGHTAAAAKTLARLEELCAACAARLPVARRATQALWNAHRYRKDDNHMLKNLTDDGEMLARLKKFLRRARRRPQAISKSCDLLAASQLLVSVRNTRPCLQGLQVQVSTDGKTYETLHTLYLLEFSAAAGQPRTNFVHIHSIPLPDAMAGRTLRVRFRRTGIGEVEIAKPVLLAGDRKVRASRVLGTTGRVVNARQLLEGGWTTIGLKAPRHGFPTPDDFNDTHFIEAEFKG